MLEAALPDTAQQLAKTVFAASAFSNLIASRRVLAIHFLLSCMMPAGCRFTSAVLLRLRDLAQLKPAMYSIERGVGLVAAFVTSERMFGTGLPRPLLASREAEGFHMNAPNGTINRIFDEVL